MVGKVIPVVIPYYKNKKELKACLAAISAQDGVTTEVFVRDNSSDNILYTRAVNEGLRKYAFSDDCDYILILTQDAYLHKNARAELVKCLEGNPQAGIAAPIQVTPGGEITWAGSLDAYPWGTHNHHLRHPTNPYTTFWANGACLLVRTSMVREIGLLDETMLFICSDCDYSFTARARGFEICVVPTAICEHYLKASAGEATAEIDAIKVADQLCFAAKWLNGRLYRQLACEGPAMIPERVAAETGQSLHQLRALRPLLEKWKDEGLAHKALTLFKKELYAS
jgi:GT2 family glycosyltransferase